MKYKKNAARAFRMPVLAASLAAVIFSTISSTASALEGIPPGFHRMPDGTLMANDPRTAVAPPGYHLMPDGTLMANSPQAEISEIPPGYHRMPDGTLMANDPANAVAPPGYHLMPDGTLMANAGGGHHHHHHGGHMHGKGMLMVQYKYSRMFMDGLRDAGEKITAQQAVDDNGDYPYMMAPEDMTMDMHMLMIMYGITDNIMLMGMGHYMSNSMGMYSEDGTRSTMETSGIADTLLAVHYKLPYKLNGKLGLSLPTGSINERGPMTHTANFTEDDVKYPYGMQLGSGTLDWIPGIAYADASGSLAWKVDLDYTLRTGENANGYTRGDKLEVKSRLDWNVTPNFTAGLKLDARSEQQISGEDEENAEDKQMSPTMDAENYGGKRVDAGLGIKFSTADKMWGVGVDYVKPVYENLWGPQMSTSWIGGIYIDYMLM